MDNKNNPCAVSQDQIHLQCLPCGAITTGNFITIVECPRCGALDYHIYKSGSEATAPIPRPRSRTPDNRDVINQMIELVKRV